MRPRPMLAIGLLAMVAIAGSRDLESQASEADRTQEDSLQLIEILGGEDTEGYNRAREPRPFEFPEDHGAHEDFRNEWWYFTGVLTTTGGRRFGYQYTLFRSAVAPTLSERESSWASRQVYMAHFALSDVEDRSFYAFERFSRGGAELAGVEVRPFRAWLDDWVISGGETVPPLRIDVQSDGTALDLELTATKPMVLNGENGLSQKGREPGNASYYYSFTRLATRGTVTVGLKSFEVQGSSWLDREWSTSALEADQVGWDWFALQLSDGTDLMVYQLRRSDGSADSLSSGTLVAVDGSSRRLRASDFEVEPRDTWTSPATGITYPSSWRIRLPEIELDLEVEPMFANQELDLTFRYWEGAVTVRGSSEGAALTGRGYVELTGYE